MKVTLFLLLATLGELCQGARILGVIPTPSYSHQVVFQPLWKELSLRGHQVTLLTTNPINDPSLTNLTEIDLSFSYKFLEDNLVEIINSSQNIFKAVDLTMLSFNNVADAQLQHPEVQKLIRDPNEHFDLVIVEYFMSPAIYFSRRFNCPYIGVLSTDGYSQAHKLLGNFDHTIVYPNQFLQIHGKPNLIQRIYLVAMEFIFDYVIDLYEISQKIVKKRFDDETPVREVLQNASLLFVNSDPIFHYVRPLLPSIIPIGGSAVRVQAKPLENNIKQFLDGAHEGFIYFSLGSNVKSKDIPAHTMNVVLETFSQLPYKVLWKYELSDLPDKPDNVMISKWVSQMQVLAHPNLKLFITHGGAQSMEEAILFRIPLVGMPFFADQPFNVQKMVSMGFALSVDYRKMSKDEFKGAILEVIHNDRYRNRIKELADLAADQPMTGLERAVWWTEYVIRHKGAHHFRSPMLDIPWYQYYLLDVISVLLITLSVVIYLVFVLSRRAFRWLNRILLGKQKAKKS